MRISGPIIAVLLTAATTLLSAIAAGRPNVLFIVSEDNSEQIGCYGDARVHTPHLDSLAAGGVRYDRAYVPCSVCSPSRAAFLTGLHTRQTGHIGLATHRCSLYKKFKTMPAYLQEAGYYTGFIGKTHVNPESVVEDHVDPPEFELYDLQEDPHELNNIANRPAHRATRDSLFQAMGSFQKEINDPFLDPENIDFYREEMRDPSRYPKRRGQDTWSHLRQFYGESPQP